MLVGNSPTIYFGDSDMTPTLRTLGLSLAALTAFALAILPARDLRSQDDKQGDKPNPIEGAWRMVEQKNGDLQDYQAPPDGIEAIKYVTGGRFVWTHVKDGRILDAAGGKYKVDKDKYAESIEYFHGEGQTSLMGKTFDFTWKVDGNTSHLVGVIKVNDQDFKIDEKWERCK
jgi:hypothetical protein